MINGKRVLLGKFHVCVGVSAFYSLIIAFYLFVLFGHHLFIQFPLVPTREDDI